MLQSIKRQAFHHNRRQLQLKIYYGERREPAWPVLVLVSKKKERVWLPLLLFSFTAVLSQRGKQPSDKFVFFSRSSEKEVICLVPCLAALWFSGSLVLSLHSGLTLLLSLISFERKEKIGGFVNIAGVQLEQVIVCCSTAAGGPFVTVGWITGFVSIRTQTIFTSHNHSNNISLL